MKGQSLAMRVMDVLRAFGPMTEAEIAYKTGADPRKVKLTVAGLDGMEAVEIERTLTETAPHAIHVWRIKPKECKP